MVRRVTMVRGGRKERRKGGRKEGMVRGGMIVRGGKKDERKGWRKESAK